MDAIVTSTKHWKLNGKLYFEVDITTFHERFVSFAKSVKSFPWFYLNVAKRLVTAWNFFGVQGRHCDIKFTSSFSHTRKFLKIASRRFRKMSSNKSDSYNLNYFKRNCSTLDFLSSFKTIIFPRICFSKPLSQKSGIKVSS